MAKPAKNDSLKVQVSADAIGVEVVGSAAPRTTNALLDAISPFTNGLGWVGDRLSEARVRAAIRAVSKAKEQLKREGITQAEIPPKILLPWLDGASLETEESETLADAWAGLFVRAAKSSDAVTVSYIETLKKLGAEEASLLQFFATDTSPVYSEKFYEQNGIHIFSESNPFLKKMLARIAGLIRNSKKDELHKLFENLGIQGMCQVIFYSTPISQTTQTDYFRQHEHAIANLEHLGLIKITTRTLSSVAGEVEITWIEITKYAFDLVWACHGVVTGRAASKPNNLVPLGDVAQKMKE